ncbi:MAG TPA: hypothetical protein VGF94_20260 [Kofleriaceae bacterium]|jgi:hypothetical protein
MRFAIVLVAACWRDVPPPPVANASEQAPGPGLVGEYRCTIAEGGYRYPPFPCAIREVDHKLELAKLGGSVRFQGEIRPRGDGFAFQGQLYCPMGDCNEQVSGSFRRIAGGALRGQLGQDHIVVELFRADSAYGGASYGGSSYGGQPPSTEIE